MEEIDNEQVIAQPEVVKEEPVSEDVVLEEVDKQPQAHADNSAQNNLIKMRAAKEKVEREKLELLQRLQQFERDAVKDNEPDYGDDDLIEGKHLKKEVEAVRKQLKAYESQAKEQADEAKLKGKYSDFDKVVNQDTISKLKEADPEFAELIALSQSSLYSRGTSTYKKIKELGLYVEDKHKQDRERAQENSSKPRPLNSVSPQQGDSPLTKANAFAGGLTPELKKQLIKEMNEAAKRY